MRYLSGIAVSAVMIGLSGCSGLPAYQVHATHTALLENNTQLSILQNAKQCTDEAALPGSNWFGKDGFSAIPANTLVTLKAQYYSNSTFCPPLVFSFTPHANHRYHIVYRVKVAKSFWHNGNCRLKITDMTTHSNVSFLLRDYQFNMWSGGGKCAGK